MAWLSTASPSLLQRTSRNRPATRISGNPCDTRCSTTRTMPTARYLAALWLLEAQGTPIAHTLHCGSEGKGRGRVTTSSVCCELGFSWDLSQFPQAALVVWSIILRFMGDLPEPVLFARNNRCVSSVMQQTQDAVGRESSAQSPQHGSAQVRG